MGKGVTVAGGRAVDEPGDALKTDTDINHFHIKLFSGAIVESFVLHKHHVSDFEAVNEVLDGRAKVATASPYILNVGDLSGVDLEGLS